MKPERTFSGFIADSEAFTEPVVNAVVVVVQKAEKNPPILVSIPAPEGRFWRNPMKRFMAKSPYAPMRIGLASFFFPSNRPKTNINVVGRSIIRNISKMFDIGLGFMNGWAALA